MKLAFFSEAWGLSACSGGSCSIGSPQLVFSSNDDIKENYILMQNSAPSSFSCLYSMKLGPHRGSNIKRKRVIPLHGEKKNNYQISWIVNSFKKKEEEEAEPFDSLALGLPVNALRIISSDWLQQPLLLFQKEEMVKGWGKEGWGGES